MKYDEGKITLKNILDDVMNEVYMTLIFFKCGSHMISLG